MLCYSCMKDKGDRQSCPYCGSSTLPVRAHYQLAPGTVVGKKYMIGRVLGEGGFGITYIGLDTILKIRVAVKEYYPHGYAHRESHSKEVAKPTSDEGVELYDRGKERFLTEAQEIARFDTDPCIVSVRDYFEENNTAYIVMEYLEGVTLKDYLEQNGRLSPEKAFSLLKPVMKALERIHDCELIHRDISPDNIMIMNDGSPILMDFGSARDFSDNNRSKSVMLKPGYAPIEQYRRRGEQGPWTDVYGICATMYRCITGEVPPDSVDRVFEDTLRRPSDMGIRISPSLEKALMKGLAVQKQDRCKSISEMLQLAEGSGCAPVRKPVPPKKDPESVNSSARYREDPYRTMPAEDVDPPVKKKIYTPPPTIIERKKDSYSPQSSQKKSSPVRVISAQENDSQQIAAAAKKSSGSSSSASSFREKLRGILFVLIIGVLAFLWFVPLTKTETTDAGKTVTKYKFFTGEIVREEYYDKSGKQTGTGTYIMSAGKKSSKTVEDMDGNKIEDVRYNSDEVMIDDTFYKNGNRVRWISYYDDGTMKRDYQYTEDGKDKKSESYDENGNKEFTTEYDNDGHKLKTSGYDESGYLYYVSYYEYDPASDKERGTKTIYYDENGTITGTSVYHYSSDGSYTITDFRGDGSKQDISYYDKNGKRTSMISYDMNGNISEIEAYDSNGKPIK